MNAACIAWNKDLQKAADTLDIFTTFKQEKGSKSQNKQYVGGAITWVLKSLYDLLNSTMFFSIE